MLQYLLSKTKTTSQAREPASYKYSPSPLPTSQGWDESTAQPLDQQLKPDRMPNVQTKTRSHAAHKGPPLSSPRTAK